MTGNRFTWGDEVRVVSRDGLCASVCAITERLDGGWRYLVEFNDGSAIELDEEDLRRPQVPIPGEWIRHDVSMDSEQRVDFLDRGSGSSAFMYLRPSETGLSIGFGVEKDGDLDLAVSWEDAERLGKALLQAVVNRS